MPVFLDRGILVYDGGGVTSVVAISGTAAASAAFSDNVSAVRLSCNADCHVLFGSSPEVGTANGIGLTSSSDAVFKVDPGEKLSVIGAAAATGQLSILEIKKQF